jgi:hypothetical protein
MQDNTRDEPLSTLQLPVRYKPRPGAFDTDPKHVRAWVRSLPLANSGETARRLFRALEEVNRLQIDPAERLKFLEACRGPMRHVADAMEAHYMGMAFPLAPKHRKVAELACTFQAAMAVGYMIVVSDLHLVTGLPAMLQRPLLVTAVQRALRHLGQVLLRSYQIYSPYPRNVWREIHQLYRFAVQQKIEHKVVSDSENVHVKGLSIFSNYKQILLLAVCGPYRLRQGDVLKVYVALEKWVEYCDLTPIKHPDHTPQGLFGVRPDTDEQPAYLELGQAAGRLTGLEWVVDTTRLGEMLREELGIAGRSSEGKTDKESVASGLSLDLLQRVMSAWGMMLKRGFSRVTKDVPVELALGLSAVYRLVGGREVLDQDRLDRELTVDTVGWRAESAEQSAEVPVHSCEVVDESTGGYRLRWSAEGTIRAQVGELVGIRERREDVEGRRDWGIGVVRWMRSATPETMEVGVQMLAPHGHGVAARICNEQRRCGEYMSCLLLPELAPIQQPETIVTPAFVAGFTDRLQVLDGGLERSVHLAKILETTGAFARFEFERLSDEEHPQEQARDEVTDLDREFSSVWSEL